MIRFLVAGLALALALLIGGFLLPTQLAIERSVVVNRPAATTFTLLNGFRTWQAWSPWVDLDPGATLTLSGPDDGVGARLSWAGDPALVGTGVQEVVVSEPFERIVLETDLGGQGMATVTYVVEGGGLGSRVSWRFETDLTEGKNGLRGLVTRYYGLFLERWIRTDFDRGLQRFKAFAERLPEWDFADASISRFTAEPFPVATVSGIEGGDTGEVATGLAVAFAELATWAAVSNLPMDAAPMAITRRGADGRDRFAAALPLPAEDNEALIRPAESGRIALGRAPSGEAVCIAHDGAPEDTLGSYERLYAWLAAHGYRETGISWERYWVDPGIPTDTPGHTDICVLIDQAAASPAPAGDALPAVPGE